MQLVETKRILLICLKIAWITVLPLFFHMDSYVLGEISKQLYVPPAKMTETHLQACEVSLQLVFSPEKGVRHARLLSLVAEGAQDPLQRRTHQSVIAPLL